MHFQQPQNKNSRARIFLPHGAASPELLSTIAVDNPVHTLVSVGVSEVPVWKFVPAVKL
jgi:hypothetical protein